VLALVASKVTGVKVMWMNAFRVPARMLQLALILQATAVCLLINLRATATPVSAVILVELT
jgi:hypothetical protein